ncbi:MAG: homoserine O-acetyltransferase [Gammaproteobacteria bacterium]|nr:homoserine O-acetyltransferase [Gammaproteobacteria bacterium]MBU2677441.1 homoserine O-acetyltransferase [Gammaproteobacteria bacterium]NNC56253.1 homoserine O-acetyltransferase [Woeseiaceae bacterium]NNL51173.1 homoserine O-acetyltransferase [Woeseiaceae bacterium]
MSLPNYLQAQIAAETEFLTVPGDFALENGERLQDVEIAYRTWGDPANAADNGILICHALTGSADVEAWWPNIIGNGKAFDPAHDYIVCANILGSCYGTTGPVSFKPGTAKRYRADFPRITVRDMVELQRILLDELGIERLELVTGPSLGGMQALEWAISYPERVRSVVPIGVGGRHSAWCIGISEAQRAAIAVDPNWNDGYYSDDAPPEDGLAAARMMAVCTYRSWDSFDRRFGRERRSEDQYQVQSYLRHQGEKINERFDANTYVTLTHAMHTHDLSRGRGEYPTVLRSILQPALVVSVSTDALYPPEEQQLLAEHLPGARYEILDSAHGHDGFLIETEALGDRIAHFRVANRTAANMKVVSSGSD